MPDRDHYQRRSIRLAGYDYSQPGAYFVTVVTQDRTSLFGEVVNGEMRLDICGRIATEEWQRTADIRPNVTIDVFVVMPNHIHGIIVIDGGRGTLQRAPTVAERFGKPISNSIPTIIRLFKSASTNRINEMRGAPGLPVWQRNYYEHVIRDEGDLAAVRQYIVDNPERWADDPENVGAGFKPAPTAQTSMYAKQERKVISKIGIRAAQCL